MILANSDYLKLQYLVPNAQCSTENGVVTDWYDERPQPTQEELDAVSTPTIDQVVEAEESNFSFRDAMKKLAQVTFEQENRLRVLENRPSVTKKQFITYVKSL
jgi:hypothetical protein